MGDRTSILAYQDEVELLDEARLELQSELGEDLAHHDAVALLAAAYLDGGLDVHEDEEDEED